MKRFACCLVLAGCHFSVDGVAADAGVVIDDDAGVDAGPDLGPVPPDFNRFDFAPPPPSDLAGRYVPDGAMPRQVGYPCAVANDCDNGFCIDGYCCDDLCDPFDPANKCMACNVPGGEGHCLAALDGTDPRGLCDQQPQSTCGRDGLCDGHANCRQWSAGTVCGTSMCAAGELTAPPACDGTGGCQPSTAAAVPCAPYVCAAGGLSCAASCTSGGAECASGATCDVSGHCNGVRGLGQPCMVPSQCQSALCQQGVCCASDCSGACRSCAQPGALGLCLFLAAGTDPLDQCTADTRDSCALDGQCDGFGACRDWPAGTPCAARTCNGDSTVASRICSGSGACLAGITVSCVNFTCNPATGLCFTQCATNAECAAGHVCKMNGKCM